MTRWCFVDGFACFCDGFRCNGYPVGEIYGLVVAGGQRKLYCRQCRDSRSKALDEKDADYKRWAASLVKCPNFEREANACDWKGTPLEMAMHLELCDELPKLRAQVKRIEERRVLEEEMAELNRKMDDLASMPSLDIDCPLQCNWSGRSAVAVAAHVEECFNAVCTQHAAAIASRDSRILSLETEVTRLRKEASQAHATVSDLKDQLLKAKDELLAATSRELALLRSLSGCENANLKS